MAVRVYFSSHSKCASANVTEGGGGRPALDLTLPCWQEAGAAEIIEHLGGECTLVLRIARAFAADWRAAGKGGPKVECIERPEPITDEIWAAVCAFIFSKSVHKLQARAARPRPMEPLLEEPDFPLRRSAPIAIPKQILRREPQARQQLSNTALRILDALKPRMLNVPPPNFALNSPKAIKSQRNYIIAVYGYDKQVASSVIDEVRTELHEQACKAHGYAA